MGSGVKELNAEVLNAVAKVLIKQQISGNRPVYHTGDNLNEARSSLSPPLTSLRVLSLHWFLSNRHSLFTFAFLHCASRLMPSGTLGMLGRQASYSKQDRSYRSVNTRLPTLLQRPTYGCSYV